MLKTGVYLTHGEWSELHCLGHMVYTDESKKELQDQINEYAYKYGLPDLSTLPEPFNKYKYTYNERLRDYSKGYAEICISDDYFWGFDI